jgi:hypothetical protein
MRKLKIISLLIPIIILSGCATNNNQIKPRDLNQTIDACQMLTDNYDWYIELDKSRQRYGIPISIQLAFIKQESAFKHDARPYKIQNGRKVLASSAYGYSQALSGTWGDYKRESGNHIAYRGNFADAVDFMGWYNNKSVKSLNLSHLDTYNLYLAYHEGHAGFKRKTFNSKAWLKNTAKKVEKQAYQYSKQLNYCKTIGNTNYNIVYF